MIHKKILFPTNLKLNIFLLLISFLFFHCSNPIEKKKKEFQNCKVEFVQAEVLKYNLILLPPIPKVYFRIILSVENNNDSEVTIEKFQFELKSIGTETQRADLKVARVSNLEEITIPPESTKEIELEMITSLEENPDKEIYKMVLNIIKALLKNETMEFVLDGSFHFDSIIGKIQVPYEKKVTTKMRL
ncbi:MAG: hypothetical protein H7A24_11495 [Leptospiraceae bacterium]|nr:hypothetical protein [Leptospiraceae bacterium]MCP5512498.1 hypothetical protein [Leptospiraceae bacterium]